jgi:aromatic ring-opening dioxygenase LigB subunit
MPLDWGTEVPLDFMRAKRIVVVAPARDLSLELHLRLGEAVAALPGRHALIASADHGHTHAADGPYGYHPASAAYDGLLQEILASDRFDFLPLAEFVDDAKADSLWQLLVLQGAVGERARADVLAYVAESYFGMLVADVAVG